MTINKKLENAKKLYLHGIRDGNIREAVTKFTGNRYTQHSTGVRDGIEGFVEFFEPFIKRNPQRDIKIIRSLVDENMIFLHVFQDINNGETRWVTTDFFDTDDNDKIIEHWDVIAPYSTTTPSGHSSIDGPTKIEDLEKTKENKKLVKNLIKDALIHEGDLSKIENYISIEQYVQHNKDVPDGFEPFKKLVAAANRPLNYTEIVFIVGQGNFVATL